MERIRDWGKKVIVVLNKVDLLSNGQVDEQVSFVRRGVERLLGFRPTIFPVSARDKTGFDVLADYVATTLDERGRLALKLASPLGVAERVGRTFVMAAEEKLALLAEDLALVES